MQPICLLEHMEKGEDIDGVSGLEVPGGNSLGSSAGPRGL